jgi:hypothetical protein
MQAYYTVDAPEYPDVNDGIDILFKFVYGGTKVYGSDLKAIMLFLDYLDSDSEQFYYDRGSSGCIRAAKDSATLDISAPYHGELFEIRVSLPLDDCVPVFRRAVALNAIFKADPVSFATDRPREDAF